MAIKQVTVGNTATTLLQAGRRKAIILVNPASNTETVWVRLDQETPLTDATATDKDNPAPTPFGIGVGTPINPGDQRVIRGEAISEEILGITGSPTTISVSEYRNDIKLTIST